MLRNSIRELSRAWLYIFLLALFFTVGIVASLVHNVSEIRREHTELALNSARSLYRSILATRQWNAGHGGVYVKVTPKTPSNPYLDDPAKDVRLPDGGRLTKVNPAYMNRLVSAYLEKEMIHTHITSLKPLRPENAPDAWERIALENFTRGRAEEYGVVGSGPSGLFRYMAPLRTEASCLECHAKYGYKEGDIRGGISVSYPFEPYDRATRHDSRLVLVEHGAFLFAGLAIVLFLGMKLLSIISQLAESLQHIRKLEGILPICSGCKKIRLAERPPEDPESWVPIDSFISDRTDTRFSHGICPECRKSLYK